MIVTYNKPYNSPAGRRFHKGLTIKFDTRKEFEQWLATNNVIVKDVKT